MTRYISYFIFLSFLMALTPLYAGSQTLTTYYPAPQGDYVNMEVNQVLTLMPYPSAYTCASLNNEIFIVDISGVLNLCEGGKAYPLATSNLWEYDLNVTPAVGNFITPVTQGENVGIGSWTADPGVALGVKGTGAFAAGNTASTWYTDVELGEFVSPFQTTPVSQIMTNDDGGWGHTKFLGYRWGNTYQFNTWSATGELNVIEFGGAGASASNFNMYDNVSGNALTISLNSSGSSYIDSGNVGIGTQSPGSHLTIAGSGVFGAADLELSNTGGGGQPWTIFSTDNAFSQGNSVGGGLLFYRNNVDAGAGTMLLDNNGNVGLGIPASVTLSSRLEIFGASDTVPIGPTPVNITSPSILVCASNNTNCGHLAVNQGTDNNYYAVYGP